MRFRDNVRGNLDPSAATAPDPRYTPIRQIIQDLITSLPNLISLEVSGTFLGLSSDLLTTINAHSSLKTVTIEDAYQLHTLPLTSANSLGRIRCRQFRMSPSAWQTILDYFSADGGARLESLFLSQSTLEELGDCTLSGLRSIVVPMPKDPTPNAGAFVARHSSLENITLQGATSFSLRSLSWLPLSEIYLEAERRGLEDALEFEELELSRIPPSPFNGDMDVSAWSVESANVRLMSHSSGGLSLFLKSLSSIQRLAISKASGENDVFSVVCSCNFDGRTTALLLISVLVCSKTSSLPFTPIAPVSATSRLSAYPRFAHEASPLPQRSLPPPASVAYPSTSLMTTSLATGLLPQSNSNSPRVDRG